METTNESKIITNPKKFAGCLTVIAVLVLLFIVFFMPVYKEVPKGYSGRHYTYKEALACARSIDANAEVSEEYTEDIQRRIWSAKINGTDCHVISDAEAFWADTILPNRLLIDYCHYRLFYSVYSDYYFSELQDIADNNPDLDSVSLSNSKITFENTYAEMNLDEFERIWNNYKTICAEIKAKNPTIRQCELWNKKENENEYALDYTYVFDEPTDDEYVENYNLILIDDVLKDHKIINQGCTSVKDPYVAWASLDYFENGSDKENVLTEEALKTLWEEYKVVTDELIDASPYINKLELQLYILEDRGNYYPRTGQFEFIDTDEKTYEKACKKLAKYMQ